MLNKVVLLGVTAASLFLAAPATAATRPIQITSTGFVPRDVTINVGDTVVFQNADAVAHQVVVQGTTCTRTIQPGQAASCPFATAGRFNYRDPNQRGNGFRGTITVTGAARSVTITAAPGTVTYGRSTTLSGAVSTGAPNERVSVVAVVCGSTTSSPVATVTTTTNGAWSLVVKPLKNTTYEARWRNVARSVAVKVRPRITLRKLSPRRFAVRVSAAEAFAGRVVVFQRYSAATRRWVRVRFVVLRAMGGTAPTVVSGANFRARIRARLRVRVVMTQRQVGACYVAGVSNVIRS